MQRYCCRASSGGLLHQLHRGRAQLPSARHAREMRERCERERCEREKKKELTLGLQFARPFQEQRSAALQHAVPCGAMRCHAVPPGLGQQTSVLLHSLSRSTADSLSKQELVQLPRFRRWPPESSRRSVGARSGRPTPCSFVQTEKPLLLLCGAVSAAELHSKL